MKRILFTLCILFLAHAASAQLVTNPTSLEMDSATHYTAPVETYRVLFTQVGAPGPFSQFDVSAAATTILDPAIVRLSITAVVPDLRRRADRLLLRDVSACTRHRP